MWSRTAWSHWWSGWAMPLLIDVNEDEVGEEGWGWGDLSTDMRMVMGMGGENVLEPWLSPFGGLLSVHIGSLSRPNMRCVV